MMTGNWLHAAGAGLSHQPFYLLLYQLSTFSLCNAMATDITCRLVFADSPAVYQLMTGCALKLQQAIHLTHPNTINVELGKHNWWECKHLEDLQLFLLDPKQDTWTIAMTEEEAEQVYE